MSPQFARPLVHGQNLYEYYKSIPTQVRMVENEDEGLASVKYLHMGVDWTDPWIMRARGLVITTNGDIVGRPYDKFFAYHQLQDIPFIADSVKPMSAWHHGHFVVMDKIDGSLVIAYSYAGKLHLSSSGSTTGEMVEQFAKVLEEDYPVSTRKALEEVTQTLTLDMEYIDPKFQIVLTYPTRKFILHGARNTFTGEYLTYSELVDLGKKIGIEVVSVHPDLNSLQELLEKINTFKDIEGFVVWFDDGFRLKFKTDEYYALHENMDNFGAKPYTKRKLTKIANLAFDDELDDVIAEYANKSYGRLAISAFTDVEKEFLEFNKTYIEAKAFIIAHYNDFVGAGRKQLMSELSTKSDLFAHLVVVLGQSYKSYVMAKQRAAEHKDLVLHHRAQVYEEIEAGGPVEMREVTEWDPVKMELLPVMVDDGHGGQVQLTKRVRVQTHSERKLRQMKSWLQFQTEEDFKIYPIEHVLNKDMVRKMFIDRVISKFKSKEVDITTL